MDVGCHLLIGSLDDSERRSSERVLRIEEGHPETIRHHVQVQESKFTVFGSKFFHRGFPLNNLLSTLTTPPYRTRPPLLLDPRQRERMEIEIERIGDGENKVKRVNTQVL